MKKFLFALIFSFSALNAYAAIEGDKIVCSIRANGIDIFFSVHEKGSDKLLIGFAGDDLSDADDEFSIRLFDTQEGKLHFRPQHLSDYPGYFDLYFDPQNMIQSGKFVSEGMEMDVVGNCLSI